MKFSALLAIPALLAMVACSSHQPISTPKNSLSQYDWTLKSATDRKDKSLPAFATAGSVLSSVVLKIDAGSFTAMTGCNQLSGNYVLDSNRFTSSALTQSLKACAPNLMAQEEAVRELFANTVKLAVSYKVPEQLVLTTKEGNTWIFAGTETPEAKYGSGGQQMFLEVSPLRESCSHPLIPTYQCLKVRDLTYDTSGMKTNVGNWYYLYEDIQGYDHKDGIRTVLRLKKFIRTDVPSDVSREALVLDMVVESEIVRR
jgi:heat shock protein HslJ